MARTSKIMILAVVIALSAGILPNSGVQAAKPDPAEVPIYDFGLPGGGGGTCSKAPYDITIGSLSFSCQYAFQFQGVCVYACFAN